MRRYHVKVTLLTLGVLLGFGSALARYAYGYPLVGPGCHGWHHGHHGYYHHHHHDCACDGDEPAPSAPSGVQSGKT